MKSLLKSFRIYSFFLVCFFLFSNRSEAQDTAVFKEINKQVWEKFEKAFQTADPDLLTSLHTEDILRIPAESNVIVAGSEYFETQQKSFKWVKDNNYSMKLELRFTERITNGKFTSERGVYRYKVIDDNSEERLYFGKFHVLLRKEHDTWKISMSTLR